MGSEEESGKDWSELEEEAARGELKILYLTLACGILLCVVGYCTECKLQTFYERFAFDFFRCGVFT